MAGQPQRLSRTVGSNGAGNERILRLAHFDDIHNEHGAWDAPVLRDVDVITLGGDIAGTPEDYLRVVQDLRDKNPTAQIFGTIGNHEHYGREIVTSTKAYEALSGAISGFEMLIGGRSVEYAGWRFIGATLWSEIPEEFAPGVQVVVNDFRLIRFGDRTLLPSDTSAVHRATVAKLDRLLSDGDNSHTVVLTHHAPSEKSWTWTGRDARDREGLQVVYCANLDALIERTQPALWLHGHIHSPADYSIGQTRIANNARGYALSDRLNPGFYEEGLIVELSASRSRAVRLGSSRETSVQAPLEAKQSAPEPIKHFRGEHYYLSNFGPGSCVDDFGITYPSVEHGFQAAKSLDRDVRLHVAALPSASAARQYGRKHIELRPDWEVERDGVVVKDAVMLALVRSKYARHPELADKLLSTGGRELVEGTGRKITGHVDRYWGVDLEHGGIGLNKHGKTTMQVREEIELARAQQLTRANGDDSSTSKQPAHTAFPSSLEPTSPVDREPIARLPRVGRALESLARIPEFLDRLSAIEPGDGFRDRVWSLSANELKHLKTGSRTPGAEDPVRGYASSTIRSVLTDYRNAVRADERFGLEHPVLAYLKPSLALQRDAKAESREHGLRKSAVEHRRPIDAEQFIDTAIRLLDQPFGGKGIPPKAVGLLMLTGRRPIELLSGEFSVSESGTDMSSGRAGATLHFAGQAMGRAGGEPAYDIPVLGSPERILDALRDLRREYPVVERLQEQFPSLAETELNTKLNGKVAGKLNEYARHHFRDELGVGLTPSDLRKAYAAITWDWYGRDGSPDLTYNAFTAASLGHREADPATALSYQSFEVVGNEVEIDRDYRIANLASAVLLESRAANEVDERTRGFIEGHVRTFREAAGGGVRPGLGRDSFDDAADALVVPVNTVGVLGAGHAKRTKAMWPAVDEVYRAALRSGDLAIGKPFAYRIGEPDVAGELKPKWLVLVPTKRDFRDASDINDVAAGIAALPALLERIGARSVSVPGLGTKLGGLDATEVFPYLERAFAQSAIDVRHYFEGIGHERDCSGPAGAIAATRNEPLVVSRQGSILDRSESRENSLPSERGDNMAVDDVGSGSQPTSETANVIALSGTLTADAKVTEGEQKQRIALKVAPAAGGLERTVVMFTEKSATWGSELKVGMVVDVTGQERTRTWQDQSGQQRTARYIAADTIARGDRSREQPPDVEDLAAYARQALPDGRVAQRNVGPQAEQQTFVLTPSPVATAHSQAVLADVTAAPERRYSGRLFLVRELEDDGTTHDIEMHYGRLISNVRLGSNIPQLVRDEVTFAGPFESEAEIRSFTGEFQTLDDFLRSHPQIAKDARVSVEALQRAPAEEKVPSTDVIRDAQVVVGSEQTMKPPIWLIIAGGRPDKQTGLVHGFDNATIDAAIDKAIAQSGLNVVREISGDAPGIDQAGERWAQRNGIPIDHNPAQWRGTAAAQADPRGYDPRAGTERNKAMGDKADALLALWDGESRGTQHMINYAKRIGIEVIVSRMDRDFALEVTPARRAPLERSIQAAIGSEDEAKPTTVDREATLTLTPRADVAAGRGPKADAAVEQHYVVLESGDAIVGRAASTWSRSALADLLTRVADHAPLSIAGPFEDQNAARHFAVHGPSDGFYSVEALLTEEPGFLLATISPAPSLVTIASGLSSGVEAAARSDQYYAMVDRQSDPHFGSTLYLCTPEELAANLRLDGEDFSRLTIAGPFPTREAASHYGKAAPDAGFQTVDAFVRQQPEFVLGNPLIHDDVVDRGALSAAVPENRRYAKTEGFPAEILQRSPSSIDIEAIANTIAMTDWSYENTDDFRVWKAGAAQVRATLETITAATRIDPVATADLVADIARQIGNESGVAMQLQSAVDAGLAFSKATSVQFSLLPVIPSDPSDMREGMRFPVDQTLEITGRSDDGRRVIGRSGGSRLSLDAELFGEYPAVGDRFEVRRIDGRDTVRSVEKELALDR